MKTASHLLPILAMISTAALVVSATTDATQPLAGVIQPPCAQDVDAACIKWGLSKALGLSIVCLSFLLKVPIIKNMLAQGSADGLTLSSLYPEMVSYGCSSAYNLLIGAPLSTFAELLIIGVQVFMIIALTWHYNKVSLAHRLTFGAVSVAFIFMCIYILPQQYQPFLMMVCTTMAILSRFTQATANMKNQHTGVLSLTSVLMQVGGNFARILTTLAEVDDYTLLLSYISSLTLNLTVLAQIIYYWSNTRKWQDAKNSTAAQEKQQVGEEKIKKVVAPGPVTQDDGDVVQRRATKSRKE